MKILFVLTSHGSLGDTGEKTGVWLEEFTAPHYAFKDTGAEIVLASPNGGAVPVDPRSKSEESQTDTTARFSDDTAAQKALETTVRLEDVQAAEFDAVFYPGGHGPLWDLAENEKSIALIARFYQSGKPVSLVCHAPAALQNVVIDEKPLVEGRKVTGFSNSEETTSGLKDVVPFLLEDRLKERGAIYQKGPDFQSFVVTDGLLITGQNPASSQEVAKSVINALTGKWGQG